MQNLSLKKTPHSVYTAASASIIVEHNWECGEFEENEIIALDDREVYCCGSCSAYTEFLEFQIGVVEAEEALRAGEQPASADIDWEQIISDLDRDYPFEFAPSPDIIRLIASETQNCRQADLSNNPFGLLSVAESDDEEEEEEEDEFDDDEDRIPDIVVCGDRAFTPNGEIRYAEETPVGPRLVCSTCHSFDHDVKDWYYEDHDGDSPICSYNCHIWSEQGIMRNSGWRPRWNDSAALTRYEQDQRDAEELERLKQLHVTNPKDQAGGNPTEHLERNRFDLINNAYTLCADPILSDFQVAEINSLNGDTVAIFDYISNNVDFIQFSPIYVFKHTQTCPILHTAKRARWQDLGRELRDCPVCIQHIPFSNFDAWGEPLYYNFNRSHRLNPLDQAGGVTEEEQEAKYDDPEPSSDVDSDGSNTGAEDDEVAQSRKELADILVALSDEQRQRIEREAIKARKETVGELKATLKHEKDILATLSGKALAIREENQQIVKMREIVQAKPTFAQKMVNTFNDQLLKVVSYIPISFFSDCSGWFFNVQETISVSLSSALLWWCNVHWFLNIFSFLSFYAVTLNFLVNVSSMAYYKYYRKVDYSPTNCYQRFKATWKTYNLVTKIQNIYENKVYREAITLVVAVISIFGILWILRRRWSAEKQKPEVEEEVSEVENKLEYADQGWLSDSAKHITKNNRIVQCIVGLFSLLVFTDFSFWKKSKDTIDFVKNIVLLRSGTDVYCSSSTCKQKLPLGHELCGVCRSNAITKIVDKEILILDSPDHILANPSAYGRRLVRDLVFEENIDWYFKLPINIQYTISKVYNCTPLDIKDKAYITFKFENSEYAWFQPPLHVTYPSYTQGSELIDCRNVTNFEVYKVHFRQSKLSEFIDNGGSDTDTHKYNVYKKLWHDTFFDFEHGPWYRTLSSAGGTKLKLYYFPIKKEQTQFSFFRRFKNYVDSIPVIGKYFDEICGIVLVACLCLVIYLKIESVKQAVNGVWETVFPGVQQKIEEYHESESLKIEDEGKSYENKRQKGYDDKRGDSTNAQTGFRHDTTAKAPKERQDRSRAREIRELKDRPFIFYDNPLKIVNSRLGYPMSKRGHPTVFAHSMAERQMYFDKGYKAAVSSFGQDNVRGEEKLTPEERIGQPGRLAATVNAFLAGSPQIEGDSSKQSRDYMPASVLADIREEMAENRKKDPKTYKMHPLMEETASILRSPIGSDERKELARQFRIKYDVPLLRNNESLDPTVATKFKTWLLGVCQTYDKKMCCSKKVETGKDCKFTHPESLTNDEGFIFKPDARDVACPTSCKTKGCPFKHVPKPVDEGLLNRVSPTTVDPRANFLIEKKIGKDSDPWLAVGQVFFNGINFLSVQHLDKQNPVSLENMRLTDQNRQNNWSIREIKNINTHVCVPTCEKNCTMNDHCIIVPNMTTEDKTRLKLNDNYKITTIKSAKVGDEIRIIRLDLKKGYCQQASAKITSIKDEYFLFDTPTTNGYSGSVIVHEATGLVIGIHKSGFDEQNNRALHYSLHALQEANNPVGSAYGSKKVLSSKVSQ